MPSWRATSSWGSQRRVPPPGMALGNSQDEGRAAVKSVRPKFMFSGTSECNHIRRQRPCGCTRQGQTRSWWGRVGPSSSGIKAFLRRGEEVPCAAGRCRVARGPGVEPGKGHQGLPGTGSSEGALPHWPLHLGLRPANGEGPFLWLRGSPGAWTQRVQPVLRGTGGGAPGWRRGP